MIFSSTPLKGSFTIQLKPSQDERGWFTRTYDKHQFAQVGHTAEWVQMNHSFTLLKGTIRGMHWQAPPYREIKLVRCIRGKVYDVIVDIRRDSPTFLQWYGEVISDRHMNMIYIPEGFAHGFQTLTENCELLYNHSAVYDPSGEKGIKYNDPMVNIVWPCEVSCISERDREHPLILKSFKGI